MKILNPSPIRIDLLCIMNKLEEQVYKLHSLNVETAGGAEPDQQRQHTTNVLGSSQMYARY